MNIEKVCSKCGEPKSLEEFHHDKRGKHERRSDCKECSSKRGRHYRETNNNKYLETSRKSGKKWYQKNKEIKLAKNRKWISENKEKWKHIKKMQRRQERQTVKGNIDCRMSRAICDSLKVKTVGGKKSRPWESLVGYSVMDLRNHLEKQFTDKMSWELFMNGKIHIDHIKPKSGYFYDSVDSQGFKDCWSLDNLQPLLAIDNLRKGAQNPHEL